MTEETERPHAEVIQTRVGDVSALASANAPFLYFDVVPTSGFRDGVANITLEAARYSTNGDQVVWDRVLVAHLRCGFQGLQSLKSAIAMIERTIAPPAGEVN